jgi:hypothetical protein
VNNPLVQRIADAILYEGYILYPYRPSVKNRQRWTFGGLYPEAYCRAQAGSDASSNQTECLIQGSPDSTIEVRVRCLHLIDRLAGEFASPLAEWSESTEPVYRLIDKLQIDDRIFQSWQEAQERTIELDSVTIGELLSRPRHQVFGWPARHWLEPLRGRDARIAGVLIRQQEAIEGIIKIDAVPLQSGLFKLRLRIANCTSLDDVDSSRDEALKRSLVSTQAILGVRLGEFVSLLDTPEACRAAAAACSNIGTWPVLVGEEGQKGTMLSAPIILYDYPRVAQESPGELFDGTEIDEILTLRILTLTEAEKQEAAAVDGRVRELLARTETLTRDELLRLHGEVHEKQPRTGGRGMSEWDPESDRPRLECLHVGAAELRPGDRVRLRPRGRADILDMVLAEKIATVEAIEQDYDGRVHLAVIVEDDPGKDLGALRQPGHRFFFAPEEIEPLIEESRQ